MISYPRLEFSVMNTRLNNLPTEKIILTPNTINGSLRKIGEKLFFGRTPPATLKKYPSTHLGLNMPRFSSTSLNTRPNDYDFSDESIGPRQFEISFVKEKEKFYVADNKRGTGLFVKIKQSVIVDHDMIVSFCASHMILQIESESNFNYLFTYPKCTTQKTKLLKFDSCRDHIKIKKKFLIRRTRK